MRAEVDTETEERKSNVKSGGMMGASVPRSSPEKYRSCITVVTEAQCNTEAQSSLHGRMHVYLETSSTLGPEDDDEEEGPSSALPLGLFPALMLLCGSKAWKSGRATLHQILHFSF